MVATKLFDPKLSRALNRGSASNPIDLGAGGSGLATVTPLAFASGTAGLTQAISYFTNPNLFSWAGGVPTLRSDNTGYMAPSTTQRSGSPFVSDVTKGMLSQRLSWVTDAVSMDLIVLTTNYRVLVNGQYVNKTFSTNGITAGGYNRINIATTDTSRTFRRFDIELDRTSAIGGNTSGTLPTIYIGANDTMMQVDNSDRLRIGLYGDSYSANTGASFQHNGFGPMLGYLLGGINVDVRQIAIGGTGYVNDASSSSQQYNYIQHITDLSQATFDLVIVSGGINDNGLSGVQEAALAFFQGARGLQANAPIIVTGSWAGATGAVAGLVTVENFISAAFTQWADARSAFIPVLTEATGSWITTTNSPVFNATGAPGGGAPDDTHPGDVGHLYLARRMNAAIRNALRSINVI